MTTPETHVKRHLTEAQKHLAAMKRERERIHELAASYQADQTQPDPEVMPLDDLTVAGPELTI